MRNPNTGKYELKKYFKSTGYEVIGTGDTKEEAKKDLKEKVEAYRKQPLVPTGEVLKSPGFAKVQYENGRVRYEYREDRTVKVMGRPGLAELLKKQEEEAKSKPETPKSNTEESQGNT